MRRQDERNDQPLPVPGIASNTFGGPAAVLAGGVQQNFWSALPAGASPARVVPAQLQADVTDFVGRSEELAELDLLLAAAERSPTAMVISAVAGTAGVGKTALALRWAHRVRSNFADGQLYVNLRGFDAGQPLSALDGLAGFLRALGVAGEDIPTDLDECAAVYRSLLNGRRMLILLDNASSVEQVRPLLPGSPSCVVLVTSRDSLSGLVARHGAHRLDLDLLPQRDALVLLAALIGDRVAAEPDQAARLAELCARLPLSLRVAAELAASRPAASLRQLVDELADKQQRLDLLDAGGDPRTAVQTVFSWSYQHLSADAARVFRLIGLHPGPDFDPYAAAALTHRSCVYSQQMLDVLARAHLVQTPRRGRYGLHDLLRVYAARLAETEETEADREDALTRLFDYYLVTSAAAMDVLIPAQRHRRPRVLPPDTPLPPLPDPATARPWLDAERDALVAVLGYTAARGYPGYTTRLADTLYRYFEAGARFPNGLSIHTHALNAARLTGEVAAEADALLNLGAVHWQQGHYRTATDYLGQVLPLARRVGDRVMECRALLSLGLVYWQQGDQEQATDFLHGALELSREIGDRVREARALASLGAVDRRQGRNPQAIEHNQQALAVAREIGDRVSEAYALAGLGAIYRRQGDYGQATTYYRQALTLGREIGDRVSEARALAGYGAIFRRQGDNQEASEQYQQALALFREVGDRHGEAHTLNCLGQSLLALGKPEQALAHYDAARSLAAQIGQRYEEAHAHDGLARLHQVAGRIDRARYNWEQALRLYTELNVPNAGLVQASLAALDGATTAAAGPGQRDQDGWPLAPRATAKVSLRARKRGGGPVTINLAEARSALEAASVRTADLLESVPDGVAPVVGSEWTVAEVGAHLVVALRTYTEAVDGSFYAVTPYLSDAETFPARLAAVTAGTLELVAEREPRALDVRRMVRLEHERSLAHAANPVLRQLCRFKKPARPLDARERRGDRVGDRETRREAHRTSSRTSIVPVTAADMSAVRSSSRRSIASRTLATRASLFAKNQAHAGNAARRSRVQGSARARRAGGGRARLRSTPRHAPGAPEAPRARGARARGALPCPSALRRGGEQR